MTYDSFIDKYFANSLIERQKVGFDQIEKLIKQAKKELSNCLKLLNIDLQIAYTCAYSAMLYSGRAFMFLKGFRPIGANKHKTVVEFVAVCLGEEYKILLKKFDNMRKKRNLLTYEPWELEVSKIDTENAIASAKEFIMVIIDKIKKENPQSEFKF